MPPECRKCGQHYWDGHPCECKPMTNDLNNIPASVRDKLAGIRNRIGTSRQMHSAGNIQSDVIFNALPAEQTAREALPMIEKLCQHNIVIVDLDDDHSLKIGEAIAKRRGYDSIDDFNTHMDDDGETLYELLLDVKAALAALKGS